MFPLKKTAIIAGALGAMITLHTASATTFVTMSDEDLARSSTVIALGDVQSIATDSGAADQIETRVVIAVADQIKGAPQRTLTVVVPGGASGDARRVVYGAPQFYRGERVLVFLRQRPDGQLAPNALAMGKYSVVEAPEGAVARRQLGADGTRVLAYDKSSGALVQNTATDEHQLDTFLDALRATVAGDRSNPAAVAVVPSAESSARWDDAFTFLGPPAARWMEPDQDLPVRYTVVPTGDATVGAASSLAAVQQAMAVWNGAGARLRLVNGGAGTPAPFQACDGASTIQFNDPFGEIGAPSNCGGVLAIGGYCTTNASTSTVNGTSFVRITEGDLTVNHGFEACRYWNATNLAELITHELGHTIGLGHSSENSKESNSALKEATMFYMAHFDGRGAALRSDDVAGVRALYPAATSPDADGDGIPDNADNCPSVANADQDDGDHDDVGDVCDPVQMRLFRMGGGSDALVLNALVRLPSDMQYQPARDSMGIELRDSGGTLYAGTVRARALRRSGHNFLRYSGPASSNDGRGLVSFRWMRGSTATLVLRANGERLAAATGEGTDLILTFAGHAMRERLTLERGADGSWVGQ